MEPRAEDGSSVMEGPHVTLSNVLKGEAAIAKVSTAAPQHRTTRLRTHCAWLWLWLRQLDAFGHLRVRRRSDDQQPPSLWENHPAGDVSALH
mgnify:CR=1 FL=1